MPDLLAGSAPSVSRRAAHALHSLERDWPETNCDLDLWIEVLGLRGFQPEALLGVCLAQTFHGDQFSLIDAQDQDLEAMFGIRINLLGLYEPLEQQVITQVARGNLLIIETDAFHLPDARGTAYRQRHTKSSIAIEAIDPARRRLDYVHNLGAWTLEGEDYDAVLLRTPGAQGEDVIPPYAEVARFEFPPLRGNALRDAARARLSFHLRHVPKSDPIAAFGAVLAPALTRLGGSNPLAFHDWAFHNLRQLGANHELLASHLEWLDAASAFEAAIADCRAISSEVKSLQFRLARAFAKRREADEQAAIAAISARRQRVIAAVAEALGN